MLTVRADPIFVVGGATYLACRAAEMSAARRSSTFMGTVTAGPEPMVMVAVVDSLALDGGAGPLADRAVVALLSRVDTLPLCDEP